MKKILSLTLALIMMLSLSVTAWAAPVRASDESTVAQIKLLNNNFGSFRQDDSWSYAVTDLDHNGRLELIATTIQGDGRTSQVKLWEVGSDLNSVAACRVDIPADESFPDILTENADTFYNPGNDLWSYTFYDSVVLSPTETYYARCAVTLANSVLGFSQMAVQHTTLTNGTPVTEYMDNDGHIISAEQYNNAGLTSNTELVRSNTNFDWFSGSAANEQRLTASYTVNKGMSQPASKADPVPTPTSAPVQTAQTSGSFLTITKHPSNESHSAGETAYFVANASAWTSLTWTFVSPYGGEFNAQSFRGSFPYCSVSGENSTTLTISNIGGDMSGWGAYCTFYNNGQTARTNTAYLYVTAKQNTTATQNYTVQNTITCPNCGARNVSIYGSCWNCGYDVYSYVNGWTGTVYVPDYYSYYYYYDPDITVFDNGDVGVSEAPGSYTIYSGDGSSVTYDRDGAYHDFGDGTYAYETYDGNSFYYDDRGNWSGISANGEWEAYDAGSNIQAGGNSEGFWTIDNNYNLETYSNLYGWGYLDDDWSYYDFY